jgi:hypothetical protein
MNWLFVSGVRVIGASASASVFPVNIQGSFPLGLTGLIVHKPDAVLGILAIITII